MAPIDLLTANDTPGRFPPSLYAATSGEPPRFPALQGAAACDVCVIGGGFTGLSAALHLAEAGFHVVLLEANRVGWGASGRNGGQVGSGQRRAQGWLERKYGPGRARALWAMGEEAKALVRDRIERHAIDCHWKPGIIYAASRPAHRADLHEEARLLQASYGYDQIDCLSEEELRGALGTGAYHGGVLDRGAGHLNPLALAFGLARAAASAGVEVREGTRVAEILPGGPVRVRTGAGDVTARFVVLASNGYHCDLDRQVSGRILPINNFIVATEPLSEDLARALIRDDVAVADTKFVVNYFRLSEDRRMVFGGGESYGYRFPRNIAPLVRQNMLAVFPQLGNARIDYAWGGTLGITLDRMPAFQRLAPSVLAAGGYSGHGLALAVLGGKLMAEAVAGTAERFDVFAALEQPRFPGGPRLRTPILRAAMTWYALRDRLG
jgi:gamma-glutamylputrescine oxidase